MTEEQKLTGLPSVDKPWLKYYSREAVEAPTPACSLYEFMYACNREHPADTALNYFGHRISFGELFAQIDRAARAFWLSASGRETWCPSCPSPRWPAWCAFTP